MNAPIILILALVLIVFSCQENIDSSLNSNPIAEQKDGLAAAANASNSPSDRSLDFPHVEVLNADLPIQLGLIDFKDERQIEQISDGKMAGITDEIQKYYIKTCGGDKASPFTMSDVYFKSIQIHNTSNTILYWIIFKHTSGKINSRILFFDNLKKAFSEYVHDFNIHALYDETAGQLTPSNLKTHFKLDVPEIEIGDFDADNQPDFKFKRLHHNGTSNAIEEIIIEIHPSGADTLKFTHTWLNQ